MTDEVDDYITQIVDQLLDRSFNSQDFRSERGSHFSKCFPESDDENDREEALEYWHPDDKKEFKDRLRLTSYTKEYWSEKKDHDLKFLTRNENNDPVTVGPCHRGLWIRHSKYLEARLTRYAKPQEIISGQYVVDISQNSDFNSTVLNALRWYVLDLGSLFEVRGRQRISHLHDSCDREKDFFLMYKAAHYFLMEDFVNRMSRLMCLDASKLYFYEIWKHADMFDDIAVLTHINQYVLEPSERIKTAKYGDCDFIVSYQYLDIPCHKAVVADFIKLSSEPFGDSLDVESHLASIQTSGNCDKAESLFLLIEWFYTKNLPKCPEIVIIMAKIAHVLKVPAFLATIERLSPPKNLRNWILWQKYGKEYNPRVWKACMTAMLFNFEQYTQWNQSQLSLVGTAHHYDPITAIYMRRLPYEDFEWLLRHPFLRANEESIFVAIERVIDLKILWVGRDDNDYDAKIARFLIDFKRLAKHIRINSIPKRLVHMLLPQVYASERERLLFKAITEHFDRITKDVDPPLPPREQWPQMLILAELPVAGAKKPQSYNNHKVYGYSFKSKKWYTLFRPRLTGSYSVVTDPDGQNLYFIVDQGPCWNSPKQRIFSLREYDLFRMRWRQSLRCLNDIKKGADHLDSFLVDTEGDSAKAVEPELSLRFMRTYNHPFILCFQYKGKRNTAHCFLAKEGTLQMHRISSEDYFPVFHYNSQDKEKQLTESRFLNLLIDRCVAPEIACTATVKESSTSPEVFGIPTVHSFNDELRTEMHRDYCTCRHDEDCVRINGVVYAFDQGKNVNKVRYFMDPDSSVERQVYPAEELIGGLPTYRRRFSSVQIGQRLLVGGGTGRIGVGAIDVFDVKTEKWMEPIRTPKLVSSNVKLMKIDMPWRIFMKEMM